MSTLEGRPGERHLFSLETLGGLEAAPVCLTANQSPGHGLPLPTANERPGQSLPPAAANERPGQSLPLPAAHPCLYSRIHLSPTFNTYIQVRSIVP